MPYILKSCVLNDALKIITNVDDNIDEMWRRLDEKYGRISKRTDAIMFDMKQLKTIQEGDDRKFIEFVDLVKKSHGDLLRIGVEHEISNSMIVGMIEEKLPATIKSMWCLEVSDEDTKVDDADKFPHLLQFLQKHRRAIEYGSSDL